MTSRASFCNRTVFGKNLRRFWPVWAGYLLVLVIIVAAMKTQFANGPYYMSTISMERYARDWFSALPSERMRLLLVLLQFPYAFLCAACCFHYLHRKRSAYTIHALPLCRGTLFRSNYFSGLLMGLVPMGIAAGVYGLLFAKVLPFDENCCSLRLLWNAVVEFVCAYGLAVFCMMVTGRIVTALLGYGAINLLGLTLGILLPSLLESISYGLYLMSVQNALCHLSPAMGFIVSGGSPLMIGLYGLGIGVGLSLLAALLYRRRPVERAEESFAFRGAEYAFRVILVLVGTFIFGYLLAIITDPELIPYAHPVRCFVYFAIALTVSWFATHLIFTRSVRLKRPAPFFAGLIAALIVLGGVIWAFRTDVFGIQAYVPPAEGLRVIRIDGNHYYVRQGITVSDPEQVAQLREACRQAAVESRAYKYHETLMIGYDNMWDTCLVEFVEKDGGVTTRRYHSSTLSYAFDNLCRDPKVCRDYYAEVHLENAELTSVSYRERTYSKRLPLSASERAELADCILQDAADGQVALGNMYEDPWVFVLVFQNGNEEYRVPVREQAARTVDFLRRHGVSPFSIRQTAAVQIVGHTEFTAEWADGNRIARCEVTLNNPIAETQTVILAGEFTAFVDGWDVESMEVIACLDDPDQNAALTVLPGKHSFQVCFIYPASEKSADWQAKLSLYPAD